MPEGMNAGNIALNLTLNKDSFNKDLGGMQQTAAGVGKKIASSLGGAANSAIGMGRKFVSATTTAARGFYNAERSIAASGKRIAAAVAGAFAITQIVKFANSCIKLGSDLTEMENVTNTVFPNMTKQVEEWSKAAANSAGQTETQAKNYIGTMGAMSKAFGFTEKEAFEMSTTVAQLVGDVSSFYNLTQDESFEKLKSIFTGETQSLKSLGVVMTQTALDEFALANGFGKLSSQMTEAEKVSLRFAFVQEKLSAASGDFTRTTNSWANQVKRLKLNFTEIQTSIGQGLINVLTPVIKWVNTLLQRLVTLANAFKSFTAMFTGKEVSPVTKATTGMVDGIEDTADATDSLADSASNAGSAAAAAAKEMKALFGFDSINKLNDDSSSGGGGGGGGGGGSSGGGDVVGDTYDMGVLDTEGIAEDLKSKLKDLIDAEDWEGIGRYAAEKVNLGLEKIYEVISWENVGPKVTPIIEAITGIINGFVDELRWDLIGADIAEGINTAVNIANGLYTGIEWDNLGSKIAESANGLVDHIDTKHIGELFANKFNALWSTLLGLVTDIKWDDIGAKIADLIKGYFDTAKLSLKSETIAKFLNGLFTSMEGFTKNLTEEDVKKIVDNIGGAINKFISTFDWKGNGTKLGEFIAKMVGALADIIDSIDWAGLGEGIGDFLSEVGPKLISAGLSLARGLINALIAGIKGLSESDVGGIALAIMGLKLAWDAAGWATGIVGAIGVGLGGSEATLTLASALKGLISAAFAHPLVTAAIGAIAIGAILVDKAFTMSDEEIKEFTTEITNRAKKLGIGQDTNYSGHEEDVEAANNGNLVQYKDTDFMYNPATGNVYTPEGYYYNNAYEQGWITDTDEAKAYNNEKHSTFDSGSVYSFGNENGVTVSGGSQRALDEFYNKYFSYDTALGKWFPNVGNKEVNVNAKATKDSSYKKTITNDYDKLKKKTVTATAKGKTDKSVTNTFGKNSAYAKYKSKKVTVTVDGKETSYYEGLLKRYRDTMSSKAISVTVRAAFDQKLDKLLSNQYVVPIKAGNAEGGIITRDGRVQRFAGGGAIPHGTLFTAGEAGPEIWGNINGRTEILNKSQLATTMHSAVATAMTPLVSLMRSITPRLAVRGDSRNQIGYSDDRIRQIAREAAETTGVSNSEIMEILRKILKWLEESDSDVYLDGTKISKRVFEEVRRVRNTTGKNPVLV